MAFRSVRTRTWRGGGSDPVPQWDCMVIIKGMLNYIGCNTVVWDYCPILGAVAAVYVGKV